MDPDEGWQVVKLRRMCCVSSATLRPHSPRYDTVVKGRCLNYLSSSHKRADCFRPTRCFNCHGLRHHLWDCKRPRRSSVASIAMDSEACAVAVGRRVVWVASQAPHGTLPSLGDEGTPDALAPTPSVARGFPEPDIVFPVAAVCSIPRLWDPMVEEAALGAAFGAPGRNCQEEIASMVEANPPVTAMSSCLSNLLPPVDGIHTPGVFRSKEEQLVGHELIIALRKFKLSNVPPLSSSIRHESSSNIEATVVHPKGNQRSYQQRKPKFKSRKLGFKVVRDLLIKKWTVVKKDKNDPHLRDLIEMVLLLETLGVTLIIVSLCQQVVILTLWYCSMSL
jgi:hypothetical protein